VSFLLDTHIWLWSLLDPDRLKPRVLGALGRQDGRLWLSPISVWELTVLVERERVELFMETEKWVAQAVQVAGLHEAPITQEIALETRRVRLPHQDPADRFLAATARVLDLTLITADRHLIASRSCRTLGNR
jgi:PIN domain nuclease of toxin-antitoxin system